MNDDLAFLAVCAVAIAGTIAVSVTRTAAPAKAPAALSQEASARNGDVEIRRLPAITVVGRRSDGELPADQLARVERNDR